MIFYVANNEGYFTHEQTHVRGQSVPKVYSMESPWYETTYEEGKVPRLSSFVSENTEVAAWVSVDPQPKEKEVGIRVITTGAMQSRFDLSEEVAINDSNDTTAKTLLTRLFNSKNIELDNLEFLQGLAYIVPLLDSLNVLYGNVSIEERMDQLTVDGTEDEAYS
jgi:hypothetical protein